MRPIYIVILLLCLSPLIASALLKLLLASAPECAIRGGGIEICMIDGQDYGPLMNNLLGWSIAGWILGPLLGAFVWLGWLLWITVYRGGKAVGKLFGLGASKIVEHPTTPVETEQKTDGFARKLLGPEPNNGSSEADPAGSQTKR